MKSRGLPRVSTRNGLDSSADRLVHTIMFTLAFIVFNCGVPAATTWIVDRHGGGDFTTIQPAVDAAAEGDTVLIGPGRYPEYSYVYGQDTYVLIEKNDITLIGSGEENTFVGPVQVIHEPNEGPRGIYCREFGGTRIEDLAVENVYSGIYVNFSSAIIERCRIQGHHIGLRGKFVEPGEVFDCEFEDCDYGILTFSPTVGVSIASCSFDFAVPHFDAGSEGIRMEDCSISGDLNGVEFMGADGVLSDSIIRGAYMYGVVVDYGASVELRDNVVEECGDAGLFVGQGARIASATGNVFVGGGNETITFNHAQWANMHENHILRLPGTYFARCEVYLSPPITELDLTNNYWGTQDLEEIADGIHDYNDDAAVNAIVLFEPIADGPVSSEPASWSDVKSIYR